MCNFEKNFSRKCDPFSGHLMEMTVPGCKGYPHEEDSVMQPVGMCTNFSICVLNRVRVS